MPATLRHRAALSPPSPARRLGPLEPFPDSPLRGTLDRQWLHYAFLSSGDEGLGMVANVAWLGPGRDAPDDDPRCTSILLLHDRSSGWTASQFNAETAAPLWSSFRAGTGQGDPGRLEIAASAARPAVALDLRRTGRPCTSQCAAFGPGHHLRWQSEPGILARGHWQLPGGGYRDLEAYGYHERVRGHWGWPELGGWVFGFANDPSGEAGSPPPTAVVFTLIQPRRPPGSATGSVMAWRRGRLRRHFPRRRVRVSVRGVLDRNRVRQVPTLSEQISVPPMAPIPASLAVEASMGRDRLLLTFTSEQAARVVIPSETSLRPFSVHEVIGPCRVEGILSGERIRYRSRGIVEFAGGASDD